MSKADIDKLKRRELVVQEIVKTEHTYNMGLQMISEIVTKRLKNAILEGKVTVSSTKIVELFESIIPVEKGSKDFTELLHRTAVKAENGTNIADSFVGFTDLIKTCFVYIYLYHEAAPIYREERKKNKNFDLLLQGYEKSLPDTIDAILITPIQRPPRYRLLLQECIKNTPENFPELPRLQVALKEVCDAITNVDKQIDEFDEAVAMTELQSKISDFDVLNTEGRRLLFQGKAVKFSRSYTNNRYLALFSDVLLVAERGIVSEYKVNKLYKSGEYMITAVQDSPPFLNAVDVRQKDKSFRCNLESKQAKDQMLDAFAKMIDMNKITRAKLEISGFAPVWIPDDQAPNCMECGCKFTFFNRRHHCRWCGKCVCGDCWKNTIELPGLSIKPQHVCNECYKRLQEMHEEIQAEYLKNPVQSDNPFLDVVDD